MYYSEQDIQTKNWRTELIPALDGNNIIKVSDILLDDIVAYQWIPGNGVVCRMMKLSNGKYFIAGPMAWVDVGLDKETIFRKFKLNKWGF